MYCLVDIGLKVVLYCYSVLRLFSYTSGGFWKPDVNSYNFIG